MTQRIRAAKNSKLARTRKVLALARSMGAEIRRSTERRVHTYYIVAPHGKRWVATNTIELWVGGAGYGAAQSCADMDAALIRVQKGLKETTI